MRPQCSGRNLSILPAGIWLMAREARITSHVPLFKFVKEWLR